MIVKRVQNDLEPIVAGQRIVAAQLACDHAAGQSIATSDAEIDRFLIEQDADLGRLACGAVDVGLLLDEIGDWFRVFPGGFVEQAV